MTDEIESMRLRTQANFDQLVTRLDAGEKYAIREARGILAKIVIEGNPVMLADIFRGMISRLDGMQNQIEQRRRELREKEGEI